MTGFRKAAIENVKSHLSRRFDRARMAYARFPVEVPRQWVAFGSTNEDRYLKDATGNRRFWPVKVGRFNLDKLRGIRDQLWAEAHTMHMKGASIRMRPELYEEAAKEQEGRAEELPEVGMILSTLGNRTGKLTMATAWTASGLAQTPENVKRVKAAFASLDWTYAPQLRMGTLGQVPGFWKGDALERLTMLSLYQDSNRQWQVIEEEPNAKAKGRAMAELGLPLEERTAVMEAMEAAARQFAPYAEGEASEDEEAPDT
jgi:hypothetical protein